MYKQSDKTYSQHVARHCGDGDAAACLSCFLRCDVPDPPAVRFQLQAAAAVDAFVISLLLHLSRALSSPLIRAGLLPTHLTAIDVGVFFWNPPCLTDSRSECSTTSVRADVVRQALAGRHHHGPSMSPSEHPISFLTAQVSQCASIHT